MRVRNPHAPPFVALLVAILAVIVLPGFADSAGPPGVIANDAPQYAALPFDTGQIVADSKKIPGATIVANITATANVAVEPNTLVAVYANIGTVANDNAPPGLAYSAEQIAVLPTPRRNLKEAHCDAILHGLGQTFAMIVTASDPGVVDYPLLC